MSKIAISGNASGTATYTIASPAGSTDRTLNLPDEAGTVLTSVSDIESQVKTATNASGTAPIYACRAWVNFNGTGTVAIRESGNVSSITDNGTGDYTVNFTTAMPDANYCAVLSTSDESNGNWKVIMQWQDSIARTTSAIRMISAGTDYSENPAGTDFSYVDVAVFR